MSSPPPTKPPRGVKQGKETSGLLMSVIRTLSASETNEQREKERAKLEKEYKKSDARLDELVAEHAQEIMEVMQKFSSVGNSLSVWGSHCEAVVARLAACRGLLRLRRDDLRRLWADARTHHYALQMLTDIERVVVSERRAREGAGAGRALGAAHTLRAALRTADTTLSHVDALHATRLHLQAQNNELVEVIVRRISDAVYRDERAPLSRRVSARRRTALLLAELTKSEEVTDAYLQDITPEYEASLSEEDKTFETTVMISLEALGVLERLKEATEKFKVQIQNELLEVIDAVSRRMIEEGDVEADQEGEEDGEIQDSEGVPETGRPLARLVASLAEEFKACATRNKRLLQLWRAALQKHHLSDSSLHTEQHYWSAVQQVVQLVLREYLQIESVQRLAGGAGVAGGGGAPAAPHLLRLTDYFAKKRPQRPHVKLFTFASAGARAEEGAGVGVAGRRACSALVCRPDPAHLHCVLPALQSLCVHIESLTGGGECSLRAFVTDYVRTGEAERLAGAARAHVHAATCAPAAWRERTAPPHDATTQQRTRHRVVYACVAGAWRACAECVRAARRCGWCGGADALRALSAALAVLAAASRGAHARLCSGAGAGRWLADDDIVRFLQSLPNWRAVTHADTDTDTPPQHELKQAYEREAEILGSSLGDGAITRKEITSDVNTLADLAVLCESMDWLSMNIKNIPSSLAGSIKLSDKALNEITAAAAVFDEISHKCLLFLHLEMRIECFYYLGQEDRDAGGGGGGGAEGEAGRGGGGAGGAGELAHALLAFHEQAANVLSPARLDYVFNGVGEMMSAGVVWRWQGEGGGGGGGAGAGGSRLGALRHCLAALHLPHDGLHRAQHYLHLLNCTPQEIIASVREKGAQFTELEYLNAFKVIGARCGLSPTDMRHHLKQLSAALGHVGVTV